MGCKVCCHLTELSRILQEHLNKLTGHSGPGGPTGQQMAMYGEAAALLVKYAMSYTSHPSACSADAFIRSRQAHGRNMLTS